jgi:hypothetical protein
VSLSRSFFVSDLPHDEIIRHANDEEGYDGGYGKVDKIDLEISARDKMRISCAEAAAITRRGFRGLL